MVLLAALLAAAPPVSERYVLAVGGVPAGVVEVRLEKGTYTYRSTQLFVGHERARVATFEVDAEGRTPDGLVPEVLSLGRARAPGCVSAVEELSGKREEVCVDERAGGTARGRIDGVAFTAGYEPDGRLAWLQLPGARVERSSAKVPARTSAFQWRYEVQRSKTAKGFGLSPSAEGVQLLAKPPAGALAADAKDEATCLDLARAYVARTPGTEVVVGLVLERGQALPHAWARRTDGGGAVDPTLPAGDAALKARRYLAFPRERAGQLYLELLSGARQVVAQRGAEGP